MFGLTQLQERLISLGIMTIAAICTFFYIEHLGAQKCLRNVEKANAIEEVKQATQYTADQGTVSNEGKTYEAVKNAPIAPAPVVRLCPQLPRQAMQNAPDARSKADGKGSSGGANSPQPALWDSTPVVKAGRDADAQIAGLQDYINQVCLHVAR